VKSSLKAGQNDPLKLPYLYYYLAEAYYYTDDYAAAADNYGRAGAAADDPKVKALAKLGLGWAYVKLKKFPEAQESFAGITPEGLDRQYQEIYYMGRAALSYETSRFAEAQQYYEKLKEMSSDPSVTVQASLGRGDCLYSRGEYAQSVEEYKELASRAAAGQFPQETLDRLHHSLAWAYLKEGQFKEAIAEFQKIANQSEDKIFKVSALCQIGDAYQDAGENQKARDAYEKILKDFPGGFYADYVQYQLGITLIKLGEYDSAIVDFLALKKNFPDSKLIDDAQYALGLAYFQKKDYSASREVFSDFQRDFKDSDLLPQALYLYGTSLFNLGQYAQAIDVFKDLIRDYSGEKERDLVQKAEYEIADCYYQMGNEKEAMSRFNQLRVKYPDSSLSAEIMWWLGEYYYRKVDLNLAVRYFSSLVHDFKDSNLIPNAYYALGSINVEEGKFEEAVANFQRVIGLSGSELGGQAVVAIADIYARQDKNDAALQSYQKALSDYPQLAHIICPKLGELLAQMGRYDEALTFYSRSLDAVPLRELPEIHLKMAEVYQTQGKTGEAIEHYLKITYLFPENRELGVKAMLRVAKIYDEQGKRADALAMYRKIADLDVAESKYARERIETIEARR
jgi:tetratricopeptide (TPR) repeat protein